MLNRLLFMLLIFLFSSAAKAQNVTGTVSDQTGVKLAGVTVIVKGLTTGTSTDNEGKFRIVAAGNATLVFSSIGFVSHYMEIGRASCRERV